MYSALLPLLRVHSFGVLLTPGHYRRRIARPVSCYALFKWWLLLSQHPGCLSNSTSLVTKQYFGTLADGLGCFPLDDEPYRSPSFSRDSRIGIRSLVRQGNRSGPLSNSVSLPPTRSCPRLYLNIFRRERAISAFD